MPRDAQVERFTEDGQEFTRVTFPVSLVIHEPSHREAVANANGQGNTMVQMPLEQTVDEIVGWMKTAVDGNGVLLEVEEGQA